MFTLEYIVLTHRTQSTVSAGETCGGGVTRFARDWRIPYIASHSWVYKKKDEYHRTLEYKAPWNQKEYSLYEVLEHFVICIIPSHKNDRYRNTTTKYDNAILDSYITYILITYYDA